MIEKSIMQRWPCKNTPKYLRSCRSPIGQNNTKEFSAQSGASIRQAVWKWSGESRFPGALSHLLVNFRETFRRADLINRAAMGRARFLLCTGFFFLTARPWAERGSCSARGLFFLFLTARPWAERGSCSARGFFFFVFVSPDADLRG